MEEFESMTKEELVPDHEMVLHSDRGSVYSSKSFNELLPMYGIMLFALANLILADRPCLTA